MDYHAHSVSAEVRPVRPGGCEPSGDRSAWYGAALPVALALCFFVAVGLGILVLSSLREAMLKDREADLTVAAMDLAERVDGLLLERALDIRTLADHVALQPGEAGETVETLRHYQTVSGYYAWVGLLDGHGRLTASTQDAPPRRDLAGDAWFAVARRSGRVLIDGPRPMVETGGRPAFVFAVPVVVADGMVQGVLAGALTLDRLQAWIETGSRGRVPLASSGSGPLQWFLMNSRGVFLHASWAAGAEAGRDSAVGGAASRSAFQPHPGWEEVAYVSDAWLTSGERLVTGSAQAKTIRDLLGIELTVVVGQDRERIAGQVHRQLWTVVGLGLLVVLPLTLFGLWASRRLVRDVAERRLAERRLDRLAYYDPLTGLPNRRLFVELLTQAMAQARRADRLVALLFLDLDRFKLVNDSLGHATGDALLKTVGARLAGCVRTTDTVARLGGDEFTVILEDLQTAADAARIAQKMLDAIAAPVVLDGHEIFVAGSVGISVFPTDSQDRGELLKNADTAMYAAKEECGTFRFYAADMNARALERLTLETALRHALKRDEFVLHYQPLVDFRTGNMVGVEALVRWRHPVRGWLSPGTFIPLAEETGLIVPLGEWVLRTACAQTKRWQANGHPDLRVAVNLSRRQFQQKDLVATIARTLADTGLDPRCLELELTESLLSQDTEGMIAMLEQLHAMGIRLSIDDFGAEYSSLGYLKRLPINTLKIDQSFVRDIATSTNDASIARAIIDLGHCLNLNVVAEGVETEGQAAFLRAQRCNEMQGYFFSRALSSDDLAALLASGGRPLPAVCEEPVGAR